MIRSSMRCLEMPLIVIEADSDNARRVLADLRIQILGRLGTSGWVE